MLVSPRDGFQSDRLNFVKFCKNMVITRDSKPRTHVNIIVWSCGLVVLRSRAAVRTCGLIVPCSGMWSCVLSLFGFVALLI